MDQKMQYTDWKLCILYIIYKLFFPYFNFILKVCEINIINLIESYISRHIFIFDKHVQF